MDIIPKRKNKIWYAPNKFESYGDEEIEAVNKCLKKGWLASNGPTSKKFEESVAKLFGKKYALFVNSGSSANLVGLASLELKPGDEVITPAQTFSTTAAPIIQLGLKPVFCDVELRTYVPSVEIIKSYITKKTKVIMIPNLIGSKPDWIGLRKLLKDIKREDIILFEDSADSITLTMESDISITSFYASHIITACGTGGMVMFNNKKYYENAYCICNWGRNAKTDSEEISDRFKSNINGVIYDDKFTYKFLGYNFKTSEICAAFGLVQLKKLPKFTKIRRQNFERYLDNLKDCEDIILPIDNGYNWLAIPLLTKDRYNLLQYLEKNNIQTRVSFSGNITRHKPYLKYFKPYKNADIIMANGFLLGCHHGITIEGVDYVCCKIKEFFYLKKYNENVWIWSTDSK